MLCKTIIRVLLLLFMFESQWLHSAEVLPDNVPQYLRFRRGNTYGIIHKTGRVVLDAKYLYLQRPDTPDVSLLFKAGDGLFGYTSCQGKIVIDPIYETAEPFSSHNYARVALNGKKGLIKRDGSIYLPIKYEKLGKCFSEGLIYASKNGKIGFLGTDLRWAIKPKFISSGLDNSYIFSQGYAVVYNNRGLCGYIDRQGDYHIPPRYTLAETFDKNGFAEVEVNDENWGLISANGKYMFKPNYQEIEHTENGRYALLKNESGFIIASMEKRGIPKKYFEKVHHIFEKYNFALVEEEANLNKEHCCGLWDIERECYWLPFDCKGKYRILGEDMLGVQFSDKSSKWLIFSLLQKQKRDVRLRQMIYSIFPKSLLPLSGMVVGVLWIHLIPL